MKSAFVLIVTAACLLAGCAGGSGGSRYAMQHDSAPDGDFNASHIPDAVPRVEPPSRYGNPDSYVVRGKRYHVKASSQGYVERGLASWYGKKFHGHRTSSGETYDMYAMTAAHKTLPLPTYAEVTNLDNDKKIIVKINDRGPFHSQRIIDLSYAAARKLDITDKGTAPVQVRALDPRQPAAPVRVKTKTNSSRYIAARMGRQPDKTGHTAGSTTAQAAADNESIFIQVGAFSSRDNAEKLRARLTQRFDDLDVAAPFHEETRLYRVRIGPLPSREQADQLVEQLARSGLGSPRLVID
ncbi:septal ring lytic transglycosylase RlpA family protein [Thiohalophilus thiocyanatoxydans]|uniref:Endolytic peptidoglycan transglycosylase RlpA n=1 Tax=Thiohalophilus thiocyanatoxydans TaxID=381308 RepID=A0A4R8IV49_9GAMM|nr:septal ring lytic transglycosylase RlpA family protein [Thiohalophilus thiocyanatoxydans]TDY04334.1 rare lipoprotein A [Thiohalophilus thiocyanatoxydans]